MGGARPRPRWAGGRPSLRRDGLAQGLAGVTSIEEVRAISNN